MLPILTPAIALIKTMLISKGMNLLASAVENGTDKAIDFVEEKTGIKLNDKKELSTNEYVKLKQLEINPETKLKLEELALKTKIEDNRHEEKLIDSANDNTGNAREMNTKIQESPNSSKLSKNAPYIIDFFVLVSTFILGILLFYVDIPQENLQIANILFGAMISYCGTILNYHRGSSSGSKDKDKLLKGIN